MALHFISQSLKGNDNLKDAHPAEILLVEDNDFDAELALRALQKNFRSLLVRRLTDGQEALDYLTPLFSMHETQWFPLPKLILLDLKLPLISGMDVLKRIKHNSRTKVIPVVVFTSSTLQEDILECYKLGVNSYVSKPVEFNKFTQSVQEVGSYWLNLNQCTQ